ncbi:unnamed protein product, partial [Rotaria sp. Silwood2]
MSRARSAHVSSILTNGMVLINGGVVDDDSDILTELYDPSTGGWTTTGNMISARYYHTASVLTDEKVLVAGGQGSSGPLASTELYDPSTGSWTHTGNM